MWRRKRRQRWVKISQYYLAIDRWKISGNSRDLFQAMVLARSYLLAFGKLPSLFFFRVRSASCTWHHHHHHHRSRVGTANVAEEKEWGKFIHLYYLAVRNVIVKNFKLLQNNPETATSFSQPPIRSYKRDKNISNCRCDNTFVCLSFKVHWHFRFSYSLLISSFVCLAFVISFAHWFSSVFLASLHLLFLILHNTIYMGIL